MRFFDAEAVSKDAEAHLGVVHVLALLAVPGVWYAVFRFFIYSYIYWHFTQAFYNAVSISDQCRYVLFSMAVVGLVAVLEWDALFPDRRDYAILTPLPLRLRTIFAAKIAALFLFASLFILAVAGLPVVFYPLMSVWGLNPDASLQHFVWMMMVHGIAVFSGCVFIILFFVALEGVLINLLSAKYFRKVSVYVQCLATLAFVCSFFLLPMIPSLLPRWERSNIRLLFALPPMWFLGLYQTLLGSHDDVFLSLARVSLAALALAAIVAATSYFVCYKRYSQTVFESSTGRRGWRLGITALVRRPFDRLALSDGPERATFYFVIKTLARSAKHRLYFAAYVALGLGIVLVGILEMTVHSAHGNLWDAFSRPGAALLSVPLVVSFFMLLGMRIAFAFPAELQANWIFQIADESNGRMCVAGIRKAMIAAGVVPVTAVMFVIYILLWGVIASVLASLLGVLLLLIVLELLLFSFRKIPFTCSRLPGNISLPASEVIYWIALAFCSYWMISLENRMLHERLPWILAVGVEVIILQRAVVHRNRSFAHGFRFQYEDDPLPAVQTLGLDA